jgi:hypothetical protein
LRLPEIPAELKDWTLIAIALGAVLVATDHAHAQSLSGSALVSALQAGRAGSVEMGRAIREDWSEGRRG